MTDLSLTLAEVAQLVRLIISLILTCVFLSYIYKNIGTRGGRRLRGDNEEEDNENKVLSDRPGN